MVGWRAAGSWLAAAIGALLLVCAGCDVEVTARSPADLHVRWAAPVDDDRSDTQFLHQHDVLGEALRGALVGHGVAAVLYHHT